MSAAGLHITFDSLTPGLRRFPIELQTRLRALGEYYANRAEAQMRSGAPWNDQTGAARAGLGATARTSATDMEIVLYHGVDYGIWLEVRWSGRYAIILPTVESVGPELMAGIRTLFA